MAGTNIRGGQILDAGVERADLNTATSGKAVVTKCLVGTNLSETSHTGADVGTGDVTIALSANPSVTSITTTAADYTNTVILKSSTTDSTRSTNIKFEDNLTAGATKLYLRKDGDALVLLTNAGTTRHKFSSETGTSNYLSGNTRIGDLTSPNAVLDVLTDGIIPTLYGSNSASGTLTLGSTKNATKAKILFGTSAYDELNNRLGVANASPARALDVTGDAGVSGDIIQDDIVRPYITVSGTSTARVFTVSIEKFSNTAGANTRFLVHWWAGVSTFGAPARPGPSGFTLAVTTGSCLGTVSWTTYNTGYTDANGDLAVTYSSSNSESDVNMYFIVEVQGILYEGSGTIKSAEIP